MSRSIFLTTTGTLGTVVIDDLGGVEFVHPVVSLDLVVPNGEFSYDEVINSNELGSPSASLQAAINAGDITLTDASGNTITDLTTTTLPLATTTNAGIAELATQGEVNTATDDQRIVTPLKSITGIKRFTDNMVINDQGLTSVATPPYTLSIQDEDFTYIEFLTTNTEGGADRGAFVCLENNGIGAANQDFALYNWQGGPFKIYTDTTPSSGVVRFNIAPNGLITVGDTANYETLVGADDDIPNVKWVQDEIAANPTDLSVGTVTTTDVPINSSTGADIATLPSATASLAGIVTANAQTFGGRKTFNDDKIIIDPTDPGTSTTLELGWFNDLAPADPNSFGMRRMDGSGVFSWMSNANFPQFFMGSPTGTGSSFIDATNNRPLNLNVLDTGVDDPGRVTVGIGGLTVAGSSEISPTNPFTVFRDDTVPILSFEVESDGTLTAGTTTAYEALVLADNDIPNRKFVVDQVATVVGADGSVNTHSDVNIAAFTPGFVAYINTSGELDTTGVLQVNNSGCSLRTVDDTGLDWCNEQVGTSGSAFAVLKKSLGTIGGELPLGVGDKIGGWGWIAQDGVTSNPGYVSAEIAGFSTDTQSGTNGGAEIRFQVTTNGTKANLVAMTIENDGTLNVAGQTDYETKVTADDDIPNKKYVDDAPKRTFAYSVSRNASNQGNQFLRRQNGAPTNTVPYIVPFDSTIYAATAENNPNDVAATWDFVVEVNGVAQVTLAVPGTDHKVTNNALSVDVSEGDEVTMRMLNQSQTVNHPSGSVFFIER